MGIRTIADQLIDAPFRARSRQFVKLGSESRIRYRGLRAQPGCKVWVGEQSIVECKILFDQPETDVRIGSRTFIGKSLIVCACGVSIGHDVLISWGCSIVDHNSHSVNFENRRDDVIDWGRGVKDWSNVSMAKVTIQDKVWVGFNAIILKGVTVGTGAVVAAGSVVTKDVEPWTVVGGNPAQIIRRLSTDARL